MQYIYIKYKILQILIKTGYLIFLRVSAYLI